MNVLFPGYWERGGGGGGGLLRINFNLSMMGKNAYPQ